MSRALEQTAENKLGPGPVLVTELFTGHLGVRVIDKKTEVQREEGLCLQ